MGFYSKLMTGNKSLGNTQAEKPQPQVVTKVKFKPDFNSIMQEKLNELKQKQQLTKEVKNTEPVDETILSMQGGRKATSRKRSRSRE